MENLLKTELIIKKCIKYISFSTLFLFIIFFMFFSFYYIDKYFLNINIQDIYYINYLPIIIALIVLSITLTISLKKTCFNLGFNTEILKFITKEKELKTKKEPKISVKALQSSDIFSKKTLNKKTYIILKEQLYLYKNGKKSELYILNTYQDKKNSFSGSILFLDYGYKLDKNFTLELNIDDINKKSYLGDFEFNIANDKIENILSDYISNIFKKDNEENKIKIVFNNNYIFLVFNYDIINYPILNENIELLENDINLIEDFILKMFKVI